MAHWWTPLNQITSGLQAKLAPQRNPLLNDPYYRFRSIDELQWAAQRGVTIDANQAGVDDWLRLPGLSIHQARSLVALRQSGVQFHCLEDLAAALSLPLQTLQPYGPILRFCYYDPTSISTIQPININTASVEMLSRLPGVDLYLARAIVQQRQQSGRYRSIAEVQQRLALPGDLMANLMHHLVV